MQPVFNPYLIECVESACRRETSALSLRMSRGVSSLASVSATASLLGLWGTVYGISNSFKSIGGSKSSRLDEIATSLSHSLVATAMGLFLAITAWCAYRYLSACMAKIRLEMEAQASQLTNTLMIHFRRSGNTQPVYFGEASKAHLRVSRSRAPFAEGITDAPRLNFDRIYRHGMLELIWPRLQSSLDAEEALQRGMWIAWIGGVMSYFLFSGNRISAVTIGSFMILAALGVRRGSVFMTAGLSAFLVFFATWQSVLQMDFTLSAFLWATIAACLTGSIRAAWGVSHNSRSSWAAVKPNRFRMYLFNALFLCLGLASWVALFPASAMER